jgi:hypothetical protein
VEPIFVHYAPTSCASYHGRSFSSKPYFCCQSSRRYSLRRTVAQVRRLLISLTLYTYPHCCSSTWVWAAQAV